VDQKPEKTNTPPRTFGVMAGSLHGLLRKGCQLLQVPLLTRSHFRALLLQTELGLPNPRENWQGCTSNTEWVVSALCSQQDATGTLRQTNTF
uniref:Uncharacterized protein n=1 Tax=Cyanoderma ruficeps TaxID=181631 RepID=A0A8C3RAX2_9PASS